MIESTTHRLLLPETIWLETEDYTEANTLSKQLSTEQQCQHCYLNLLGLRGLTTWLSDRLSTESIVHHIEATLQTYYIEVDGFTITAIAVENLLDEMVQVSPQQLENHPTHFYALLEINEEAAEAIFRGIVRRDRLDTYLAQHESLQLANGDYSLPLSWFDPEPHHLIVYCQHLSPEAIALPAATPQITVPDSAPTKLAQWLQNMVVEGWSLVETLIDPEMNLAFNTRSVTQEYQKGKLLDLGIELNNLKLTLLVMVKQEAEEKLGVRIQLYPASKARYLPSQVQLTLLSKAGKTLQSVRAGQQDNYIQLKPFKGKLGKRFSLEIALGNTKIREFFEL